MWLVRLMFGIVLALWTGVAVGHWVDAWGILVFVAMFWFYMATIGRTPVLVCSFFAVVFGGIIFWHARYSSSSALAVPVGYFFAALTVPGEIRPRKPRPTRTPPQP